MNVTRIPGTQSRFRNVVGASSQVAPSNPAGTSSGVGVMMGLGSVATFTPRRNGKAFMQFIGGMQNTGANISECQLKYGTGTAPVNGATATGTFISGFVPMTGTGLTSFTSGGVATGLVAGTTYWADLALLAVAGTASIANLSFSAFEIP